MYVINKGIFSLLGNQYINKSRSDLIWIILLKIKCYYVQFPFPYSLLYTFYTHSDCGCFINLIREREREQQNVEKWYDIFK